MARRARPRCCSASRCPRTGSGCSSGVLPLDDVESGAIDLAGRLAELVDRAADGGRRARAHAADRRRWAAALAAAADALTAYRAARRLAARASCSGSSTTSPARRRAARTELALAELRDAARRPPQGPPDARELPHRPPDDLHARADAVGPASRRLPARLDDGVFPRKTPRDGDDLLLDDPHIGERDARTEDRQLLLDALLAADRPADRHLHRQRRAHEPRPPAGGADRRAARPSIGARRRLVVVRAPAAAVRPAQLRRRERWCRTRPGASTR